uniref:TM2 domain-containing protein 1-like n=1 Tax=Saccoglossus kowalevskii TaxID=10224 RepID=A0ABM0MQ80_SACKO|nr:PREDICTED: TM2 domain-containing protein 1-like [Saccoglossus kowalevskii]
MAASGLYMYGAHEVIIFLFIVCVFCDVVVLATDAWELECEDLLMGQYYCSKPDIDPDTQAPEGCTKESTVAVNCFPAPNITCSGVTYNGTQVGFQKNVPCRYTNGVYYEVSVLLSIFLGMFGIDRFYLGYPAIGLLKFCTLGFFFLGQLIDVILIASQVVGPADGSEYIIDAFGARLIHITLDNETFYKPPDYW